MQPSYDLGQRPVVLATHRVDRWLLGAVGLLVALGLLLVLDASFFVGADMYGDPFRIARRQLGFALVAAAEAALLTRVRSDVLRKFAYPSLVLESTRCRVRGVLLKGWSDWPAALCFGQLAQDDGR